ncbi:helix-turn-helix domain-containing protein [Kitasatospora sp. NPDC048286]|uniref:helix-turn-helix domain-containing protein n=1 Tax=Kitasatospora sp. NPDC048286 TaxID=3364047 RepID=UPI003714DF04
MSINIRALTDASAVLKAMAEHDELGQSAFLARYKYGTADQYFVQYDGRLYGAKAIAGAAYGFQYPDAGAPPRAEFSGGEAHTNDALRALGFTVVSRVPADEEFGAWLARQIRNKGMSQSELAHELGVTRAAVTAWVVGRARPQPATMSQLAEVLGSGTAPVDVPVDSPQEATAVLGALRERPANQSPQPKRDAATTPNEIRPGDIRTRAEIKPVFGGSPQGGICPADEERNVLLFSDESAGALYGYKDGWLAEEDELGRVFEYTGAGRRGDQTFGGLYGKGNSAVLRHAEMGRTLRLFIAAGDDPNSEAKLHRYVGPFKLDEDKPYIVRIARDENNAERRVIVFRLREAGQVDVAEADKIKPAPKTIAKPVPADTTAAKVVEPERNKNKKGFRSAAPETEAERREAVLSDAFEAYLKAKGHEVCRFEIRVKGKTTRLLTDLYDMTDHVLYELKGTNRREAVRMALGQLLDYGRYVKTDDHPEVPRRVVLLPALPDEDMQDLLGEHGIGVAYQDGGTFLGVPPSFN